MRVKANYIVIPLAALATALAGSFFTAQGIGPRWYSTLLKPDWIPPDWVYGVVWTGIFVLAAISALIVWNRAPRDIHFHEIIMLFVLNALLNMFWSALFFAFHLTGFAVIEAALLCLETLALAIFVWTRSKTAGWLLAPYVAWAAFATYLAYAIWALN